MREPCDLITTTYIAYGRQLVDMLTKGLLIERQPTYLQDLNDRYLFTNLKECCKHNFYYLYILYCACNFWEELSTSQV